MFLLHILLKTIKIANILRHHYLTKNASTLPVYA